MCLADEVILPDNITSVPMFFAEKNDLDQIKEKFMEDFDGLHKKFMDFSLSIKDFVDGRQPVQPAINRTGNRYEFEGELYTMNELADKHGIKVKTVYSRLRKGMSLYSALRTPVTKRQRGPNIFVKGKQ